MFFFNDTATTEIYTLSLHDALPILAIATQEELADKMVSNMKEVTARGAEVFAFTTEGHTQIDRKSTRLNSSHANISYAVFCLKKKNMKITLPHSLVPTISYPDSLFQ